MRFLLAALLMPNPRGSFGEGEGFTRANVKDFGYGDLRDIVRGVDAAVRSAPVDPKRVGIYGHSYGGYMTMWAVTRTSRFAAAVASAGIANWQSYYGQNRIDQWMLPYFGKSVYEDPDVYARSSPITFIQRSRTPTLVLHGERDAEVPLPQGYEFWHALKSLGVTTQLVVYEDEGTLDQAAGSRAGPGGADRRLVRLPSQGRTRAASALKLLPATHLAALKPTGGGRYRSGRTEASR
jgi:dipeptidyl aminopeptidase/acylaminoacyl peptidase